MKENYIEWLNSYQFHGIKPGLKRIKEILKKLGNPHKYLKAVHIAGTNGKGSTSAIIAEVLSKHGLKVGLYTSPHLFRLNERFKVNGREIEAERLNDCLKILKETIKEMECTYFEITTALAFLYFCEEKVDVAVIECGLGGRLDATNIITPEVSVITSIGWDHTKYLGNTLEKIALEKAGIIKKGKPCVLGKVEEKLIPVFQKKAERMGAELFIYGRDFSIELSEKGGWNYIGEHKFLDLKLHLKGHYQGNNLGCALKTLELLEKKKIFKLSEERLRKALKEIKIPGRYEFLKIRDKTILIDTAHNLSGFTALKDSLLKDNFKDFLLILGVTNEDGEKPFVEMLEILFPLARKIYLCEFDSPRKVVTIEDWKERLKFLAINPAKIEFIENSQKAVKICLESNFKKVLICGSIYFVKDFLRYLNDKN